MRVVLTVDFSPWSPYSGGAQRSTDRLAQALARRGHRVTVVYTRALLDRTQAPPGLPYAVRWARLPALRSRRAAPLRPLSGLAVREVLRELLADAREPTIVHCNGEEGAFLPALRERRRFALVATPRHPGYPAAFADGWPRSLAARLRIAAVDGKYLAQGVVARAADRVCPPSAYAGELVARAFAIAPSRITPVHNGVDPVFLDAAPRRPPAAGPLLFFGRLEADKGILELVDAWRRLPAPPPLQVVGRGSLEAELRARRAALPATHRLELLDWQAPAALAELARAAGLVALPSRRESFGNAIAEAMAVGAPVLTADATALPELVRHGERGWLVPPGDVEALAAALARLIEDAPLRATLGAAAARWAREHLSWDATAARFEAIYADLADRDTNADLRAPE
ncbi:MAG: glycosyltransferase family 4 protein [Nannocystaceae bacterium]